jgi:hypothetical protein
MGVCLASPKRERLSAPLSVAALVAAAMRRSPLPRPALVLHERKVRHARRYV